MIAVGLLSTRDQDHDGFVIGNRKVGLLATVASLGAGFRDVGFVTFWFMFSFLYGYGLFVTISGIIASSCILAIAAPKIRKRAGERNYITAGQMIEDGLGPISRYSSSVMILLISLLFSAAQLLVLGEIFSRTLDVPAYYTVPCVAFIVGFYLWAGGYGNVIKTDFIQFFVILSFVLLPFIIPVSAERLLDWKSAGSMGWIETLSMVFVFGISGFVNPDMWQRLFSAKDGKTIQWALPLSGVMLAVLTFGLVVLGMYAADVMPEEAPDQLLYRFFELSILPPYVLAGIVLVLFSMGMSTLDTQIYLFTSTVLRDFMHTRVKDKERQNYIFYSRVIITLALVFMCVLALFFENAITLLMGVIGGYGVTAPMFIIAAFGLIKTPGPWIDRSIAISVGLGFIVFIYMFVQNMFSAGFVYSLPPLLVSVICSVIVCLYYSFIRTGEKT